MNDQDTFFGASIDCEKCGSNFFKQFKGDELKPLNPPMDHDPIPKFDQTTHGAVDGKYIPEVGNPCLFMTLESGISNQCTPLFIGKEVCVIELLGMEHFFKMENIEFCPLEKPEQKAAREIFDKAVDTLKQKHFVIDRKEEMIIQALYDKGMLKLDNK